MIKMERWKIQADEMDLKNLLLYLASSSNWEYDTNRACDVESIAYNKEANRYELTVAQHFQGGGFTSRLESALQYHKIEHTKIS